jgi:hypothetical protein
MSSRRARVDPQMLRNEPIGEARRADARGEDLSLPERMAQEGCNTAGASFTDEAFFDGRASGLRSRVVAPRR